MLLRGIALVFHPVVLWVFLSQRIHVVITIGLGQYRSSGNAQILAVALDDGGMGQGYWFIVMGCGFLIRFEPVAVDDDGFWANLQLV